MGEALRSPPHRAPRDGSNVGAVIQAYMHARGVVTTGEMASILGIDRTLVSKYVNGSRRCHDVTQLRHFAEAMDLPPETFGLIAAPDDRPAGGSASDDEAQQWRLVRRTLNRHRDELTRAAADLYWDPVRIAGTTCITRSDWMPAEPVPLDSIELEWLSDAAPPKIVGSEPSSAPYRPHGPTGERYGRYSQAIRALASPALFENRVSYRLLDLGWTSSGGLMSYGYTTYFDMVDVCEPLAHEIAAGWLQRHESGGCVVHYQPTFDLQSRQVCGLEALVRWQHPERGLLPPSEFLPAAENSSLIQPLTMWVLAHALADQAEWISRGARWPVSVNVSARNLEMPQFADRIVDMVQAHGSSDLLTVELTETALGADPVTAEIGIRALGEAGIDVSLDDFGTGYTSLMQLRSLAVSEIKIDAVFVSDLGSNEADRQLVRAIVDLAHGIGCRVVAEGVEQPDTATWLTSIGCDAAQGYHFARPGSWQSALARFGPSDPTGNDPVSISTGASREVTS